MRRLALVLTAALLVGGCGSDQSEQTARAERRAKREQAALDHIKQPPAVKTHAVGAHQLITVEIPVADRAGRSLGQQTCFVWRDTEFQAATLSCPSRDVYVGE